MTRGIFETLLGAIVLVIAISFASYVYSARDGASSASYPLSVRFNTGLGLKPATEVRLGGVRIGTVQSLELDKITLQAVVGIVVDDAIRLPVDSRAEIATAGLLGDSFLSIIPGTSATHLSAGAEITRTKDPVSLEDLLGQAIFALSEK